MKFVKWWLLENKVVEDTLKVSLCVNNAVFQLKKSQGLKNKMILEYLYNIIIQDQYSKAHYGVKVFMVFTIYKSCLVDKIFHKWNLCGKNKPYWCYWSYWHMWMTVILHPWKLQFINVVDLIDIVCLVINIIFIHVFISLILSFSLMKFIFINV